MAPSELVASIRAAPSAPGMVTRVVAVDGHGGAGKSTLAARLADALHAPVVHTDDFASWDCPVGWWPRLLDQVLRPLSSGRPARYQRYDWDTGQLAEWIDLPVVDVVIVEGVSASRLEFVPYLAFAIWVDTPRELCLERGLARDGERERAQWERWMAAEDVFFARDRPRERADVVVSGDS